MNTRPQVLIDCDPGHDDAIAILLAAELTDIQAITTVAGNTNLENTTRNALAVVDLTNQQIPVFSGASQPLQGTTQNAEHVHGKRGFGGVELPDPVTQLTGTDAVDQIIQYSHDVAELWIIAIGPLTNIALALQKDPQLAERIAGFSVMGGSTNHGNATATAEFNIWADPEAAKIVFDSQARVKLCGLNLTRQFMSDDALITELQKSPAPKAKLMAELYSYMHLRMDELVGERAAALHDPCAVLAITHPDMFEFTHLPVDVELNGKLTRGMTVVDQRLSKNKAPANVEVAMTIDATRARHLLVKHFT
ncbi:MAG: inosine-uridine nucleoside N-ribohydrolase [Limisphaerales bacterium]|jgi:inosine-uridine nucleoside N-ribohydrolase